MGEEVWPCLLYPVNPVLRSRRGADDPRDKKHAGGLFFTWFKCHCSIPGEIEMFLTVSCAREEWKLKWKRGWGRDCEPRAVSERVGEAGKGLVGLWADNYVWSLAGRRVDTLGLFGNSALFLDNDQSHRLTGSWPLENIVFCQLRVEAGEQVLEYVSKLLRSELNNVLNCSLNDTVLALTFPDSGHWNIPIGCSGTHKYDCTCKIMLS